MKASARSPRAETDQPEQPSDSPPSGAISSWISGERRPNRPSVSPGGKVRTSGPGQSRRASRRPTSGILGTQSVDSSSPLTRRVSGCVRGRSAQAPQPSQTLALQGAGRERIRGLGRQADHSPLGQARHGLVNHVARIVTTGEIDPRARCRVVSHRNPSSPRSANRPEAPIKTREWTSSPSSSTTPPAS